LITALNQAEQLDRYLTEDRLSPIEQIQNLCMLFHMSEDTELQIKAVQVAKSHPEVFETKESVLQRLFLRVKGASSELAFSELDVLFRSDPQGKRGRVFLELREFVLMAKEYLKEHPNEKIQKRLQAFSFSDERMKSITTEELEALRIQIFNAIGSQVHFGHIGQIRREIKRHIQEIV
jgi:hypothetical protein